MSEATEAPTMTLVSSERTNHFPWVWFLWLASGAVFLLVSQGLISLMLAMDVPAVWTLIPGIATFVAWLLVLARLYRRFDFRTERNIELANEQTHRLQFVMYPFGRFLVSRLVVRHNGEEVPVNRLGFRRVDQAEFQFGEDPPHQATLYIDERVSLLSFRLGRAWRLLVDGYDVGTIK